MTLEQALDVLSILNSADDPIVFDGHSIDVCDMWELPDTALVHLAKDINVEFYSHGELKKGTFFSMVVDRMLVTEDASQ